MSDTNVPKLLGVREACDLLHLTQRGVGLLRIVEWGFNGFFPSSHFP